MNCTDAKQAMANRLAGGRATPDFDRHLAECEVCSQEWDEVSRTWNRMSSLPEESPSPAVRARFYQMLEAYEEGLHAAGSRPVRATSWWRQPVWQFATAASLLV